MGSRDKDHSTPHQPLLSSLVVRPTDGGGAAGGGVSTGAGGPGSDYEPGEVRRHAATGPHSRSDRFSDDRGYRLGAGSVTPVRHKSDNRYSPGFDHSGALPRSQNFGRGRDQSRLRDHSPRHGRARDGSRFNTRGFDGPGHGPGPFRGEAAARNNPNVHPREGDWICSDPTCNNLNFARREICNNCKKPRNAATRSPPRRGFPAPPPLSPRRFPGPLDRSPGRMMNGYRSPPRGWARDDPRDFRGVPPYARHEGRFPDIPLRRPDYAADEYRERSRFERYAPLDWSHRDRARDSFLNERKGYDRRALSPPPVAPPPRGQWARDIRERSRSPIRGGAPLKDYRRDIYMGRGRDDRRGMGRPAY